MYICICNEIREKELAQVVGQGALSVRDAFDKLGCGPVCGSCIPNMRECLKERGCAMSTITD